MSKNAKTIRYPIGFKLMFIITVLLALSLGAITILVSTLVSMDIRVTAENTNFSANYNAAAAAEQFFAVNNSAVRILLRTLDTFDQADERNAAVNYFFRENGDIAALITDRLSLVNDTFFLVHEADPSRIVPFLDSRAGYLARTSEGESFVLNAAPEFEIPMLVLLLQDSSGQTAAAFVSSAVLARYFGESGNVSCLINSEGDVLVHPDQSMINSGANIKNDPFVETMRGRGDLRMQNLYTDFSGTRYFGAFSKLNAANLAVITTIEYDVVFEGIAATTKRNCWLSAGVLFISVLCVWFFSKTISVPLKKLSAAAGKVKEGNFNIVLKSGNRDEIGLLTESFVEMSRGLAERERLKDTFGRFINKEVAEKALKGELKLGGENRTVTVFFSDIRDFTAISEKMSPQDVLEFLNSYLVRMVACVSKTGGVVDKFIGDAIMAIWGAPVSTGNVARDALACVRAALLMRAALREYNRGRDGVEKPRLRIGCGINTGDVVVGQIGSKERMEYTVIGDTVNLASRTESLNKPFGTDILVTENTWKLIKDYIITEEMPGVTVKGKEAPVRMFAVVNMKVTKPGMEQPGPHTLAEIRKQLGINEPDMKKTNANSMEVKYKIHD
ncbi:MAG: HAMP domain-containing protein [Treponema sp.]|jgi:adenylate cyclase|nr:HAMP domain-containing protein [Treponema sp.]